jgi:hypothetical protein
MMARRSWRSPWRFSTNPVMYSSVNVVRHVRRPPLVGEALPVQSRPVHLDSHRSPDCMCQCQQLDPSSGVDVEVPEYLLRRALIARARNERQVADAVAAARLAGLSWSRIGKELGVSAQAAQQRYGFVEATS